MSKIEVDTIDTVTGTTELTIGGTNATDVTLGSGVKITNLLSTGIDDNATSTAVTIDSSGNVSVGTTEAPATVATTSSVEGLGYQANDYLAISRAGTSEQGNLILNKLTNDGDIIVLNKNGTKVGSIGVQNSDLAIYSTASLHAGLYFGGLQILPTNNSGAFSDNTTDLGDPTVRFDDIFATNGTIQTSDENEKQSIQSLTTAEMNVAKRLSPLIKTFKWNSSVEEKGDSARTHTGIIAQDVQQAFTDEGLDADNYALFISDTWWEKEISVDAVAEEVDENGNVITEAKDAYTYMDTKEEATDGYTERTRLGVRYPELLSFIQAYNDQRFTELEARITALENK
jgi:hypothetical protein